MQSTTINLVEATSNKIEERIRKMIKLRKEIINNTNNFREFKIIKSDIIHQLVEYESDFRQLNTIIKSVTSQNTIQKENAEINQKQMEKLETNIKYFERENFQILEINQELQRRLASVTSSNCDKDSYINDLLTKITYLENIIKDYQKKYEVMRICPETFEHKIPRTDNYLSKYNEFTRSNNNNIPCDLSYKKNLNLNYDYDKEFSLIDNIKPSLKSNFSSKNIKKIDSFINEVSNPSLFVLRPRSSKNLIENHFNDLEASSSRPYLDMRSYINDLKEEAYHKNLSPRGSLNLDFNKSGNNIINEIKKSVLNDYPSYEKSSLNNNYKENQEIVKDFQSNNNLNNNEIRNSKFIENNILNKKLSVEDLRISNNSNKNINMINEFRDENLKDNNLYNPAFEFEENTNFTKSNGGPFKKPSDQFIYSNENHINNSKGLNEKDKANLVSEILLKVFSSDSINTTLKRKYGEDLQFKLTDKNVDSAFLLEVEKDVKTLLNKEKLQNKPIGNINDPVNYKEIRRSIRTHSPEGKYIDPNNPYFKKKILEMTNNSKNFNSNKSYNFNEPMKSSGGFDSNRKSIDKIMNIENNEPRERSNSSSIKRIDLLKNGSKAQDRNGFTSLKDYFINNSNFVKNLGKNESPVK